MQNRKILTLTISLLLIGSVCLYAQDKAPQQLPDLSGTWVGDTETPNGTDTLTVTLTKKGDAYSGYISDSLGMLHQTPLQGIRYEKGVMTFYFMIVTESSEMRVDSTIRLNGAKLSGEWAIGTDMTGSYILERKK